MTELDRGERGSQFQLERFGYAQDNPLTQRLTDILTEGNVGKKFSDFYGTQTAVNMLGLKSVKDTDWFFPILEAELKTPGEELSPDLIKLAIGVDFGNQIKSGFYSQNEQIDRFVETSFFQTEPELDWTRPSFILNIAPAQDLAIVHQVMDDISKTIGWEIGPLDLNAPHVVFDKEDEKEQRVVIEWPRPVIINPQIKKILNAYDNAA